MILITVGEGRDDQLMSLIRKLLLLLLPKTLAQHFDQVFSCFLQSNVLSVDKVPSAADSKLFKVKLKCSTSNFCRIYDDHKNLRKQD